MSAPLKRDTFVVEMTKQSSVTCCCCLLLSCYPGAALQQEDARGNNINILWGLGFF